MNLEQKILSDITIFTKYAKFLEKKNRRETWTEIVTRNKEMHIKKYPMLKEEIEQAYELVYEKKVLPSMRSLQFAGKAVTLNNARMFNCSYTPVDDPLTFSEIMFLLLSGCGVGYSVQKHHIEKLPQIITPTKDRKFLIGDSIIGWSDAVKVLMKAYFTGRPRPIFDFSDIRPRGAPLKTSGGIAPGPEPLKDCLHNIQRILDRKKTGEQLTPLEVHDIICFIADAVLAGGIRRRACIALFSLSDQEMLESKFNHWYELNPQRGRANNSAVLLRHRITGDTFADLWEKIKNSGSGEPGFFMSNDQEMGLNPCAEVSLRAHGFCNLCTINVSDITTQDEYNLRAKAASLIGTLQAGYTDFHYLRDCWKKCAEEDALIGVSMTGIASGGILNLDITEASKIVAKENARVARIIGINKAARCTVVKPEGTASLVAGSSSGIHAWHSPYYIRRMRLSKNEPIYRYLAENIPALIEDDYFKPTTQAILSVPQKAPEGAITRDESALDLLERVSRVYVDWIVPGHRKGHNKNNVSTTVSIKEDEWEAVGNWMWNNRDKYTALSVLPYDGHTYVQPPFEEISEFKYNEMIGLLHDIDLTKVNEADDQTSQREELACAGGVCEL